ncbi:MAG: histidine phosphatase family protein [Pirellulales bacterium]
MCKFALILPGATDYDLQGRIQGTLDVPLNERGCEQVDRLVEALRGLEISVVYAAPCARSQQTAERLAVALDVKTVVLDQFDNLNQGLWQGMLVDEVKRKQPKVYRQWQEQPEAICPPQGETLEDARERVRPALQKILKKNKQNVVGVVVPEPLASIVRSELVGAQLGDLWKACSESGRWELLDPAAHALTNGH